MVKESNQHYNLPKRETQTISSKIWTRVADSISYNGNCYTKRPSA